MKKTFADIYSMTPSELRSFVAGLERMYRSERASIAQQEQAMATQMPNLMAGNIDDINKVIWPFFFVASETDNTAIQIPPNVGQSAYINITQEAGFVVTEIVKTVFRVIDLGAGNYNMEYVNPNDLTDQGLAKNLEFEIIDSSSSRRFHQNQMSVNHMGGPKNTWKLDTPLFFAPNSNIEIAFSNNSLTETFAPIFVFKGYRLRVNDARELLSQVSS